MQSAEQKEPLANLKAPKASTSFDQLLRAAAAASVDRPVGVHLKLETGLGRNGIAPEDYRVVFAEAARLERIGKLRIIGLFSHLSNASADDDRAALRVFHDGIAAAAALGIAPPLRHIAASHAAIDLPESRMGCVRLGISIYGLSPFDDRSSADLGLRPAMTLRAPVAAVRRVPAGHGVSYGYDYRTERETTLALIPLGYADGVPRSASGRGPVAVGGTPFAVAGRIAANPTHATRMTKRLLRVAGQQSLSEVLETSAGYQALAHACADHSEAVAALQEKRAPVFKGD